MPWILDARLRHCLFGLTSFAIKLRYYGTFAIPKVILPFGSSPANLWIGAPWELSTDA
jgi:hypothetical protein